MSRLTIPGSRALNFLRKANTVNLMHAADVERPSRVAVPGRPGRYVDAWTVVLPQVPCRMNPVGAASAVLVAAQRNLVVDWVIDFDWRTRILEGDRMLVRGQDDPNDSDTAWQRLVLVTRVLWPRATLTTLLAFCTDVVVEGPQ